jgi:hypothetical protein
MAGNGLLLATAIGFSRCSGVTVAVLVGAAAAAAGAESGGGEGDFLGDGDAFFSPKPLPFLASNLDQLEKNAFVVVRDRECNADGTTKACTVPRTNRRRPILLHIVFLSCRLKKRSGMTKTINPWTEGDYNDGKKMWLLGMRFGRSVCVDHTVKRLKIEESIAFEIFSRQHAIIHAPSR